MFSINQITQFTKLAKHINLHTINSFIHKKARHMSHHHKAAPR